MDAYEYLVIEQTLHERLEDAERFSLEQAFHSEAPADAEADRDGAVEPAEGDVVPDVRGWHRPAPQSC